MDKVLAKIKEYMEIESKCNGICGGCPLNKDMIYGETQYWTVCDVIDKLATVLKED